MRTSERVRCSRFPVESAALTPVASPADVARRATATDAAPRIVFVICVLAVAARLIFINQPYVDHWSWRQSDVAAIARNFCKTDFVSAIRKLIGQATRPVTSERNFQFCPSSRRFATSLRVCTNGSGEFRRSFCSRFRCHFSFCSSARSLEARQRSGRVSSIVLRH